MTITQISPEANLDATTILEPPRGTKDIDSGQRTTGAAHLALVAVEQIPPRAKACSTPATAAPAGSILPSPTLPGTAPNEPPSATESNIDSGHEPGDAHTCRAAVEQSPRDRAIGAPTSASATPGLADPTLALAAAVVDDLERTRISNENRLRQLTRTETDADGEERGFGLDESHPDVARLAAIVAGLAGLEHDAVLGLQRQMRKHPLGPWVKAQVGIGEKQAARLLAAIGDPYWNTLHNRPRTVSELWAYCGLHVVPGDRRTNDAPTSSVAGDQTCDPGHFPLDAHKGSAGVAARRRKGQKANWSADAKMRAYLIATSCMKQRNSPYREVYDSRRAHTAVTHPDWTDGHSHNDALRITAKAVLREMWREAKRISEETS